MLTIHPGEYLRITYLEPESKTQKSLAKELGVSASAMSRLIEGKSEVSIKMALALEEALGRSAESWVMMQVQHSLQEARKKSR